MFCTSAKSKESCDFLNTIITILITVLIFGLLIFIHEFGHFITAKLCGVRVHEFALGMGPKLFSFGKKETQYSLRLLPIGGYVKMEGEDSESQDERAFCNKKVWQRIIIVSAGAIMNLILGFVILVICVCAFSHLISSTTIAEFSENAVTEQSGLQIGDKIIEINGKRVNISNDVVFELQRTKTTQDGKYLLADMTVVRNGQKVEINDVKFLYKKISDEKTQTSYNQLIIDFKVQGIKKNILSVIKQAFFEGVVIGKSIWISLVDLVSDFQLNKISGVVGVGEVIGEATFAGIDYLLNIVTFITINLGIFNLLPIPALDGGRLLFLIFEAVFRKPIPAKYEGIIHAVGFIILIGFMFLVMFKDIFVLFAR